MEYNTLKTKEVTTRVIEELTKRNVQAFTVESGKDALEKIKELIPAGASVMNGASVTLEQIGFVDYLKRGEHSWNNLHEGIIAEKDPVIQASLRKQAVLADYYLGSVHALTETGEYLIASNSGSQLPHIVFTSANLIFVVSTKKIVPNITEAMNRLMEYIMPIEDKHMKEKYGVGTAANKILIVNGENPTMQRKVTMILVNEDLGF
jgi:L-lactate utilization protein LutC